MTHDTKEAIPEGSRNSALMSFVSKKWSGGISKSALRTCLLEENALRSSPPLPHGEVIRIVESVSSYKPGHTKFLHSWKDQFRNSDLPSSRKLVLFVLADHMNGSGKSCYPTQTQIAKETSLSRKTVGTYLERCEELGWITRYQHNSSDQEF